jgi:hypothetical protein
MEGGILDTSKVTEHPRPPLGIKPKWLHDEQRREDIIEAAFRCYEAKKPIPIEWINEYNERLPK